VIPTTRPQASQTEDLVSRLRTDVLPKEHVTSYVTGTTAGTVDFTEQITGRMVWLILAVVVIAFILLTMAFRSVVIATKAAILNLLSIGAAYGVIVAIFQWGWGASLIGVHTTLPIPAYVPMLVFAIVFGLSMDYEVFLLSRVHEAWIETGDPHRAVAVGIGATARVITTAAAIMVVVFASFVLSTDPTVKMLAIGMAFAVLIDASLVRMILVPSIMALLDARAWWMPRWMEPIVPQLQLEGSTAPAASAAPVAPAPAAPAPAGAAQTAAAKDTEAETETEAETATAAATETAAQAVPADAETAAERETGAATETEAETAAEAATETEAETATASGVRRPPSAK
jgi:RND superfamily putative drug exporter